MSVSAAQTSAFFVETLREEAVWGIRDDGGFPAPLNGDDLRSMPFWSLRSRAALIIARVPAYEGFEVTQIPLSDFVERWLPGLEKDGIRVGLNWSGRSATGYDLLAKDVADRLASSES